MRAELLTAANSLPMNLAAPPGPWFGGWMCWWLRGSGGSRSLYLHHEPWKKETPLTPPHLHDIHTLDDGPGPTLNPTLNPTRTLALTLNPTHNHAQVAALPCPRPWHRPTMRWMHGGRGWRPRGEVACSPPGWCCPGCWWSATCEEWWLRAYRAVWFHIV